MIENPVLTAIVLVAMIIFLSLACAFVYMTTPNKFRFFDLPVAYCHRGFWGGEIPENSLTAFKKCAEKEIGVELDVQPTKDGKIVVGKTSSLLGSSAAMLINALKEIAGIDDSVDIIDPLVIGHVEALKKKHLGHNNARLHLDEALLALAVSAPNNPNAAKALDALDELRGCECHSTVILSQVDTSTFRKLGLNLSCEPKYQTKKLFHN